MIESPNQPKAQREERREATSFAAILEELRNDISGVLSGTFALLRQELSENTLRTRKAAWKVAIHMMVCSIGALFVVAGINLLAIDLLSPEILSVETAAWLCVLVSGSTLLAFGIIFTKRSAKKLRVESLIPDRTLESLEQSFQWAADKAEEVMRK